VFICSACGSSKLKSISYSSFKEKLKNKETFFLVVTRDGCQYCEKFVPTVEEVLSEYEVTGYNLNYTDLSDSDKELFDPEYNVDSTPTTIFIRDGEEISILQRIEGNVSKEKLVAKLKSNGYINE
jgi:predicted bacteriocin transport accessory protein